MSRPGLGPAPTIGGRWPTSALARPSWSDPRSAPWATPRRSPTDDWTVRSQRRPDPGVPARVRVTNEAGDREVMLLRRAGRGAPAVRRGPRRARRAHRPSAASTPALPAPGRPLLDGLRGASARLRPSLRSRSTSTGEGAGDPYAVCILRRMSRRYGAEGVRDRVSTPSCCPCSSGSPAHRAGTGGTCDGRPAGAPDPHPPAHPGRRPGGGGQALRGPPRPAGRRAHHRGEPTRHHAGPVPPPVGDPAIATGASGSATCSAATGRWAPAPGCRR